MTEPIISLTKDQFLEQIQRALGPLEPHLIDVASMIFDDCVRTGRSTLTGEQYYDSAEEAYIEPFGPANPCRQMETRACVDLSVNDSNHFRVKPCAAGECTRHPNSDRRESSN